MTGKVLHWATIISVIVVLFTFASIQPAQAQTKDFNVPAQSATTGIPEFARQARIQILVSEPLVRGKRIAAVTGSHSVEEALAILLRGTGLVATSKDGATYTVAASPPSSTSRSSTAPASVLAATQPASENSPSTIVPESKSRIPEEPKLEEIVVTGRYEFLSVDTSGATNLPLPVEKVPQSISLVSGDFIKAADLNTLGEIAEYTPGAINVGNQLGLGSLIKLRGFSPARAVDGINVQGGTLFEPDFAIFDRLEVVKGPTSVVYGVSSPGGLVNYVTKSATPQTIDYLYARAGMWNSYRLEGQITGALDSEGNIRAIGVVVRDQGDSFMDQISHGTTTLYGGININLSDSVTAYLHGGYERDVRTAFDGIPTEADGSPAPLPRSFFIGDKNFEIKTDVYHAESDLTWHATQMLDFSVKGNFETSNSPGIIPYSFGLDAQGNVGLGIEKFSEERNENYGIGLSSIYRFDALGLKNSFVSLAVLLQDNRLDSVTSNPIAAPTVNIFDGEAAITQAFESLANGAFFPFDVTIHTKVTTVAAQSVLQLIDPLSLLLGASYSKPDVTEVANLFPTDYSIPGQVSYRAGLIYEFLPRLNAYVSFSQSFDPQELLAVGNKVLPPLIGEQYEGGLKYRSSDGRLLLTGALFQITQKNQGEFDTVINGGDYFKPIGELTHKGLELEALGHITREWQINAGYSYLDPKITKDSDPMEIGQTELFLPKQSASVYSTYTLGDGVLHGLSFGGGARYVASQRTAYDNSTKDLPGYVLVDATLGYAVNHWIVQLNAHNIFDRRYFINNYQTLFYGNVVGEPANVALSIRREF